MKRDHCRREVEISLLAAGALGEEEKAALLRHLETCNQCRTQLSEARALAMRFRVWEERSSHFEPSPTARARWAALAGPQEAIPRQWINNVWHELIWPSRYAWSAMAALWLLMLLVNGRLLAGNGGRGPEQTQSPDEIRQAWQDQNRVMAELTRPAIAQFTTIEALPRPRSELDSDWAIL